MGANYYENLLSVGVSYTWEKLDPDDNAPPNDWAASGLLCTTTTTTTPNPGAPPKPPKKKNIRRVMSMDLSVAEVDLSSTAGVMAGSQSTYNSRIQSSAASSQYFKPDDEEAIFLGSAPLKSASVQEGSNTNVIITNLHFDDAKDDKDPNDQDEEEADPDPVSRTEEITVSRDLKNKSYQIVHAYSVSFGSDFKAVTNHSNNTDEGLSGAETYSTTAGREAIGKSEADAVFTNVADYNKYLDLSAYQTASGWDVAALNKGCSGVSSSSSQTSDKINGDYSKTKTTTLRYTGQDLETGDAAYDITYSIDWTLNKLPGSPTECLLLTMKGDVKGRASVQCGSGGMTAAEATQSGYDAWVDAPAGGGTASGEKRVEEVFEYIIDNVELDGVSQGTLNKGMTSLTSSTCIPSVNKGAPNDGVISFEFSKDNCVSARGPQTPPSGSPYTFSETKSSSYSWEKDCLGVERKITSYTVNGSVGGVCGVQSDGSRWASVSSVYSAASASGKAAASGFLDDPNWAIQSESSSSSSYGANASYSYTYSNKGTGCSKPSAYNECMQIENRVTTAKSAAARTVTAYTSNGIVTETRGSGRAGSATSFTIKNHRATGCSGSLGDFLDTASGELNDVAPSCLIQSLNWTFNKNWGVDATEVSLDVSMEGIN